ncbi:MAG TPA: nucleotidyl transferase AbiEii/AbiGii toxin family protein [Steroidobacteraceae bacterium]|nr:nucleotidyl transferase AbiEii/AbiGii toxin family protein [Steroidobacteraceae bacterium]
MQEWSAHAPWPDSRQIEQDLILSRALCDLFNAPALAGKIAFRGGTAINKLLFKQPLRYSEDIDLVQTQPGGIGETVDGIRECLSWLGECRRNQAGHSMHLIFRFTPEAYPGTELKLKVEINTREHSNLLGLKKYPFAVDSSWYQGKADLASFEAEEIFGTKLRALLQRRKNRDLFDLNEGLHHTWTGSRGDVAKSAIADVDVADRNLRRPAKCRRRAGDWPHCLENQRHEPQRDAGTHEN